MEANLMKVEGHVKRYETLAGWPLHDDIPVTALVGSCVKEFRERMKTSYKEVIGDIEAYNEKRCDAPADGQSPMDIGSQEEE